MRKSLVFASLIILLAVNSFAQDKSFVFPQIADGVFPDGTYYRSTLTVQQWLSSAPVTCAFRHEGLTTTIPASFIVPINGWLQTRTPGTQVFKSGYGVLTCDGSVFANLSFAFYSPAGKAGEATVFGVKPTSRFRVVSNQTEGARVGLAIANDTDLARTYVITLRRADGSTFGTGNVSVGARQALAKFIDELVPSSTNQILEVEIRANDFTDFSVIGLRFTGGVFTTIPAN